MTFCIKRFCFSSLVFWTLAQYTYVPTYLLEISSKIRSCTTLYLWNFLRYNLLNIRFQKPQFEKIAFKNWSPWRLNFSTVGFYGIDNCKYLHVTVSEKTQLSTKKIIRGMKVVSCRIFYDKSNGTSARVWKCFYKELKIFITDWG